MNEDQIMQTNKDKVKTNFEWILTIGINQYYLTTQEKVFYLDSIAKGQKYIVVSETKILGSNFQTLVHISVPEETRNLEEGKWLCIEGNWHSKSSTCYCGKEAIFEGNKVARWIDKGEELRLEA